MYNGHGDVTALLGTDGTVKGTYYYDAFGNITEQTGDVNNSVTYAGYQYDKETDLYYLNARYYDSKTARFLSEDTYTGDPNDPLSLNLYTYCANEPLMYSDPTGHYKQDDEIYSADVQIQLYNYGQDYANAKNPNDKKKAMENADKLREKARDKGMYASASSAADVQKLNYAQSLTAKAKADCKPEVKKSTNDAGKNPVNAETQLDYGNGSITVNGIKVPIFVPSYSNGTNSNYDSKGWVTLNNQSLRLFYQDTNWAKAIVDIGSAYGEECAAVKVSLNDVIYLNGSKSGQISNAATYQSPLIAGLVLGCEVLNSINTNTTGYFLTVAIQKSGNQYRAVLQLESNRNQLQQNGGQSYYHLDTGNLNEPGRELFVGALKDDLRDMGYGKYIEGDHKTNIYITVDSAHKNDASMGYLSLKNGQLILTPKLYKRDDMKIVNNTEFLGICTGYKTRLDIRKDMQKQTILSDYGINIVNKAAAGKIIFNK